MRSVAPALLPIFRSQHQAGLLSRLFLTDAEVPMTDLARELSVPLTTLHREADRLEEAGLLASRRVGRTRLLRANAEHPAARPLAELLTVTYGPAQIIAEEFAGIGADRVIVFGSWARRLAGERGRFPNDVDVLVVGDYALRAAAYRAADAAQRRLGFEVNPTIRTPQEWSTEPHDALVADIRERGFITVAVRERQENPVGTVSLSPSEEATGSKVQEPDHVDGMIVTRRLSDMDLQKNLPLNLELLREVLRSHRVGRAWLFGSRSRGDHRADSDVDLLYEPAGEKLQLLEYGRLVSALGDTCPVPIDLADAIVDRMKPHIADDLVRVL